MGNSDNGGWGKPTLRVIWVLAAGVMLALISILYWNVRSRQNLARMNFNSPLSNNMAVYRYNFGGVTNTHYLNDVVNLSIYRRPEAIDQVVFFLENTDYYVLNADIMEDYRISPDSVIEKKVVMNAMFHHYDPYLQGEKQEMHRQWVNEQYREFAGRSATDEEWLAALNELTRGVEHHQMQRWIKYSPPAIDYWLTKRLPHLISKTPSDAEKNHLIELLQSGITYEQIESRIGVNKQPQG